MSVLRFRLLKCHAGGQISMKNRIANTHSFHITYHGRHWVLLLLDLTLNSSEGVNNNPLLVALQYSVQGISSRIYMYLSRQWRWTACDPLEHSRIQSYHYNSCNWSSSKRWGRYSLNFALEALGWMPLFFCHTRRVPPYRLNYFNYKIIVVDWILLFSNGSQSCSPPLAWKIHIISWWNTLNTVLESY